jgi:hypothetical protein
VLFAEFEGGDGVGVGVWFEVLACVGFVLSSSQPDVAREDVFQLCRKFCSGGREGTVAPVYGGD